MLKWQQLPNLPPRIDHRHYAVISGVHLLNKNFQGLGENTVMVNVP